jgi:hypothetical protein
MTADVCVGVAAVAGCQRDREWFARADIHPVRGVVALCVYE